MAGRTPISPAHNPTVHRKQAMALGSQHENFLHQLGLPTCVSSSPQVSQGWVPCVDAPWHLAAVDWMSRRWCIDCSVSDPWEVCSFRESGSVLSSEKDQGLQKRGILSFPVRSHNYHNLEQKDWDISMKQLGVMTGCVVLALVIEGKFRKGRAEEETRKGQH